MSTRKGDEGMSNPKPENQERLDELAKSIWTPEELEEARRKWDELDLAMEFSSAVDRKEAVRRFLEDQLDAATKGPFKGVLGDFPEGMSGDLLATQEDKVLAKLAEVLAETKGQRAEQKEQVKEGIREIQVELAAKRKAENEKAQKAQLMTKDEILKKFEEDHRAPDTSDASMDTLLSGARKWVDFVETEGKLSHDQWESRALINRYLQHLKDKKYKPKYILKLYGIAEMVFKTVDRTWPMPKRAAPKVEWRDISKPTLEPEQVGAMIKVAKDKRLTNEESAYLALSTVYLMRANELALVADEDIDYEKGVIYVKTVKGGERREQLLAREIVSYLKRHKFGKSYVKIYGEPSSKYRMRQIYHSIEHTAGLPFMKGFGWHAIRRAGENVLVPWNITVAHIFTRWSPQGIPLQYVTERLKFDQEVFDGPHPFLWMWRD